MTPSTAPVAQGWSDWHVVSNGYQEFDYYMNLNGKVVFYGGPTGRCGVTARPNNYGVDVLNSAARSFLERPEAQTWASPSHATRHSTASRRTRPRGSHSTSRAR